MAFFAILNPIGNLPVFISLTSTDDEKIAEVVARQALILSAIIIAVVTLFGKDIFRLFGINLAALRIISGIIIIIIGYDMLHGKISSLQHNVDPTMSPIEQEKSVAVSPLAMPILAGPGTISTAMNLATKDNQFVVILSFVVLCVITYFLFVYGKLIVAKLGKNVITVITRLMGLILAVIGTDMTIAGLKIAFRFMR